MRQREWNIEPGDIVSYIESWVDGPDELCHGVVMSIHLDDNRDLRSVDVKLLPLYEGEPTLPVNVSQVEGIWHLAN